MTSKMVFEFVLMELNKQNAPSIDLETFNYFFNKAINQFVNKQYNVGVDTDQQRTDDIRVLKSSTVLKPSKTPKDLSDIITNFLDKKDDDSGSKGNAAVINTDSIYGATYECDIANKMNAPKEILVDVAGKCCESGDIIRKDVLIPNVESGDIMLVYATGAYNYSMFSNYNNMLKPAVILVGSNVKVISRRETLEDLCKLF